MQTLKTAIVVVFLLAVLYGVYVVLNKPEMPMPEELVWQQQEEFAPPEVDFGMPGSPTGGPAVSMGSPVDSGPVDSGPAVSDPADAGPAGLDSLDPDANRYAESGGHLSPPTGRLGLPTAEPTGRPKQAEPVEHKHGSHSAEAVVSKPPTARASYGSAPADPLADAGTDSAYARREVASYEPPVGSEVQLPAGETGGGSAGSAAAGAKGEAAAAITVGAFKKARATAQEQIQTGQWHEALFTLSIFYDSPDLSSEEQQQLLDVLDPLAGKVIYSNEHLLEPAYKIRSDETLMDIAERYDIPWQLLQKINGVENPQVLVPGNELKVVRGPFRAEVNLTKKELTLFLGRLYAGRFPVTFGADPEPQAGQYEVRDKQQDRAYYATDGRTFQPTDPRNPYGGWWLDLGGEFCIHGSGQSPTEETASLGCISLSPIDAGDVFGILSQGSRVVIRR